jgi:hypothetical protein
MVRVEDVVIRIGVLAKGSIATSIYVPSVTRMSVTPGNSGSVAFPPLVGI